MKLDEHRQIVARRDKLTPTPEQRAQWIWNRLHGQMSQITPKPWDLICFSVETLALLAAEYTFLQPVIKKLVSIVYTAHYYTDEVYSSSCPMNQQVTDQASLKQSSSEKTGLSQIAQLDLKE